MSLWHKHEAYKHLVHGQTRLISARLPPRLNRVAVAASPTEGKVASFLDSACIALDGKVDVSCHAHQPRGDYPSSALHLVFLRLALDPYALSSTYRHFVHFPFNVSSSISPIPPFKPFLSLSLRCSLTSSPLITPPFTSLIILSLQTRPSAQCLCLLISYSLTSFLRAFSCPLIFQPLFSSPPREPCPHPLGLASLPPSPPLFPHPCSSLYSPDMSVRLPTAVTAREHFLANGPSLWDYAN